METTRHFVATAYVVHDERTLLHDHEKLGMWLPPGGHVDRDELPHEAALREVREETGLDVTLLAESTGPESDTVRPLPDPQQLLLEDIDTHENGRVSHQHVDFVFFGRADTDEITPAPGEVTADAWEWVAAADLRANPERYESDVIEMGTEAIDLVGRTDRE